MYPIPEFCFKVEIEKVGEIIFQEVSGLEAEPQAIQYRQGHGPAFPTVPVPGIQKTSNVHLKKGVFTNSHNFRNWLLAFKHNTVQRTLVTISLLDENANPAMAWSFQHAWPTKISGVSLESDGSKMIVEEIDLAHEGCTVKTPHK